MQSNKSMADQLAELDEVFKFTTVIEKYHEIIDGTDLPMDIRHQVLDLLQYTYMFGYRHGKESTACIYQVGEYQKL